ncbi:MAG: MFS transporter [Rhizobiales bacterium]|nr:MFS transporter [Hyphomicrobiales bacterium]
MQRNIKLYPWFQACRNLLFWQAVWFLYFQNVLSAAEAVMLAAIYDIGTLILEVPSGYMSDRIGRRITLITATLATLAGCVMLGLGSSFYVFALAQIMLGAGSAFVSGTDHALLYDSLIEDGRQDDVAWHEARAWRFTFAALAISAMIGGLISMYAMHMAFLATALTAAAALVLTMLLQEPAHRDDGFTPLAQGKAILERLRHRGLAWLFTLSVAMYVFSHVPFVFAQPFINEVLAGIGFAAETPAVSGAIVASMMLTSVAAAWFALPLARRIGKTGIFLLALAMQVGLVAVLAFTVHPAALALLLLRMVPDAFARPMILAYVQPRLKSSYRATYLSLQSLIGRLILAASLFAISFAVPDNSILRQADLQAVLPWYVGAGLFLLIVLAVTSRVLKDD